VLGAGESPRYRAFSKPLRSHWVSVQAMASREAHAPPDAMPARDPPGT